MIYRGCCDRFMCFRQPSERWRHVHQGYWALSSFTLEEKGEEHALPVCSLQKSFLKPAQLLWVAAHVILENLTNLDELYEEFVLYFPPPPPPSLVERGWWTEGAPLTAVRLASLGLFPQSLSSSGEWSIRSDRQWLPFQSKKTIFEPIIIMAYCTQEEH